MTEKIANTLNTGKRKLTAVAICSALILTLGTTAAFAASAVAEKGPVLVKNEDGNSSYSTDHGQTWDSGLPEGAVFTQNEDGSSTVTMGAPSIAGNGQGLMTKNENGVMSYSTDGGQTWSDTLPDGFEAVQTPDGGIGIQFGGSVAKIAGAEGGSMLVKNEDGVKSYSTDGGETWVEGTPEGAAITEDAEGRKFVTMGELPMPGDGVSFMVKNINGVESYSTDGGQTWSETLPEGVTKNADGSVSYKAE